MELPRPEEAIWVEVGEKGLVEEVEDVAPAIDLGKGWEDVPSHCRICS